MALDQFSASPALAGSPVTRSTPMTSTPPGSPGGFHFPARRLPHESPLRPLGSAMSNEEEIQFEVPEDGPQSCSDTDLSPRKKDVTVNKIDTPNQLAEEEGLVRQFLEARTRRGPTASPQMIVDDLKGRGNATVTVDEVRALWDEGICPAERAKRPAADQGGVAHSPHLTAR
jgi:hypothetical protein